MFTNRINRIHNCVHQDEILQLGVESVKEAVGCDRVVVYSIQPQTLGKILAEAVNSQFPKTMGTTIADPCFEAGYIDKYQQGRMRIFIIIIKS